MKIPTLINQVFFLALIFLAFSWASCGDDPDDQDDFGTDLTGYIYDPTGFTLVQPTNFPQAEIPADNPLTEQGISLGRHLFYDPILSLDSTISCASCHQQSSAFAANVAFSSGVDGTEGIRNSMSLANLAFAKNGFNWDGSSASLEEQALIPVEHVLEMHEMWPNVIKKLERHPDYPIMYREAFGIENSQEIDKELTVKALASFIRTLVSYQSEFDWAAGFVDPANRPFLDDDAQRGADLFATETGALIGEAECTHCHGGRLFTDHSFRNNGIDEVADLQDFEDKGRGGVNGNPVDYGKFKVTTLRNIAVTGPYMHDGRIVSLEDVMTHYNEDLKSSPNLDGLFADRIGGLGLSAIDKADLVAFMESLTDTAFLNNPDFSSPFE